MYEFREPLGHDRLGDGDSGVVVVAVVSEYLNFLFVWGKAQSAKSKSLISDEHLSFRLIRLKIYCFTWIFVTFSRSLRELRY